IAAAAAELDHSSESGLNAADAILTSDTRRKVCTAVVGTDAGKIHVSGMAKGAGMIEPDMATMLAYICTGARVAQSHLQQLLARCATLYFSAFTADGD